MTDVLNCRRNVREDIEIQSWSLLKTTDNKQYLLKTYFQEVDLSYDVMVYDGVYTWAEKNNLDEFKEKCKTFNPNIEAEPSYLLNHVQKSLEECQKSSSIELTGFTSTTIWFSVKSKLQGGIPFNWTFELVKCDIAVVNKHLWDPMFIMIAELSRRQQELYLLLEKKDREIQDYKDQGTTVTRKHLETMPFNKSVFQDTSNVDQTFLTRCKEKLSYSSFPSSGITDLYRNVLINKQCIEKTDIIPVAHSATFDTVPIEERPIDPAATNLPSWSAVGRLPASLIDDGGGQLEQQDTSPNKSLVKNIEQERREALRKRLEEETERKKKKKKRKLNI